MWDVSRERKRGSSGESKVSFYYLVGDEEHTVNHFHFSFLSYSISLLSFYLFSCSNQETLVIWKSILQVVVL